VDSTVVVDDNDDNEERKHEGFDKQRLSVCVPACPCLFTSSPVSLPRPTQNPAPAAAAAAIAP